MATINGTELRRSSRHSKTPRPSIERAESSQPDPKRRRSTGTEAPPSPAPTPNIPDEILVAPARNAVRGIEASAGDGIGEEVSEPSIRPPLPWFAGMMSQYTK
ncbi:hypothetical protein FOMG_17350 [Fusarium oxysporum f. sp. melonis 26406]|uniref:Uncharacterized protein n=1 Tax=Fusarium oxysporum f. sp. melonis 26406 TaxID=1089452 RepID=W9ZYD2_FUSOX|nr:hypothetical protein FOMG_17350 [Fusarium oxysporum f. sp. melonis 26406]